MTNNDILRRLRYALELTDAQMVSFFARHRQGLTEEEARAFLGKEEEEGTTMCPNDLMGNFLDSLIIDKRGPPKAGARPPEKAPLTNNSILKKIRIALNLHEGDMLAILDAGGQPMSKGELTALFRKPGHKHHRVCGDQVLRAFLRGLTLRMRPSE
jgi:uncharacterized protein YehS (DUF1456 family)